MIRRSKVFLPRWVRWFVVVMLALEWGFVSWLTFFQPDQSERIDIGVWAIVSIVLVMVGVLVGLSASRKLPIYEVESEEEEPPRRKP